MAGARMVGMGVRDQRPLDRPGRIDMKAAELAAYAGRRRHAGCLQDASLVINKHFLDAPRACMTDTGPLFVSSGDLIADRRYKWALDHAAQGDFAGAADILAQTVELAPRFATAWFALGAIRDQLGDRDGAIAAFEQARDADPEDYHGARLQLARLGAGEADAGDDRDLCPPAVRPICRPLRRRAHRAPALSRTGAAARRGRSRDARGRPAVALRLDARSRLRHRARRRGVSPVCRLARRRRSFAGDDRAGRRQGPLRPARHCATSRIFSPTKRGDDAKYHLVIAADVFVYVNDLAPIFAALRASSRPDGLLAFTVETHAGDGVKLLPTLRYAHGEAYLRGALGAAGLMPSHLAKAAVRSEKGVPVDSLVVVAQASTAMPQAR